MKTKYYIKSYTKVDQSFLSYINSIDDTYGSPQEPYDVVLDKKVFFGLITKEVTKRITLPKGFNAKEELTKGREWVG